MQKTRSPILLLFAAAAIACLCAAAAGVWLWNSFSGRPAETLPARTETIAAATRTTVEADETSQPAGGDSTPEPSNPDDPDSGALDSDVIQSMEQVQQQVIQIRSLQPAGAFTRAIFSPEELRTRVIDDFFSDYSPEEAGDDTLILSLFGLIDSDFDLINLYTELFSEQVAGFYDDETGEMVVVSSSGFGGPEKLTYAHEYQHALQDQNYDFDEGMGYNDETCEEDTERCAAIQALVEGDATLTELQWFFDYASDEDRRQIFEYYTQTDSQVYDSSPAYLQQDFIFPYEQGYAFVQYLFDEGGWANVDAAFADPPVSTEQILHPEKYPVDTPVSVALPDLLPTLGDGWEQLDDNAMGEWYLFLILAHGKEAAWRVDEDQASEAAAGWGGDRYQAYRNRRTGEAAMVLKIVWDDSEDSAEFSAAFRAYAAARFGAGSPGENGGAVWQAGDRVHLYIETGGASIWIAAPDEQTAAAMLAAVR